MKKNLRIFGVLFLLFSVIAVAAQTTICPNPQCHGGKIYCDNCDYTGKIKGETCPKCNGAGYYPCPNCNGTGMVNTSGSVSTTGNAVNTVSGNSPVNSNANNNGNANQSNSLTRHQFECPDCKGKGAIPKSCSNPQCHNGIISCANCNATGTVGHTCTVCNGTGTVPTHRKYPCPECQGKKYVTQEKQVKCTCRNGKVPAPNRPSKAQSSESVWVDHTVCHGTGFVTVKEQVQCPYCSGRAYMIEREVTTVSCESCGGSGYIKGTCPQCGGKGSYVCPDCKGYGNVREKCSRCNGNGFIYTE